MCRKGFEMKISKLMTEHVCRDYINPEKMIKTGMYLRTEKICF